jgi:elongation factor 1-gamma
METVASLAPNSGLIPTDNQARAKVAQWESFGETELAARLDLANGMFNNYVPFVKPVFTNRMEKVASSLEYLEKYLSTNTFLVGDRITLADISVASILADGFSKFLGPEEQKKYQNCLRFEQT